MTSPPTPPYGEEHHPRLASGCAIPVIGEGT
jgi:hypothetical protein